MIKKLFNQVMLTCMLAISVISCTRHASEKPSQGISFPSLNEVGVYGLLGEELNSSKEGRLKHFIQNKNSEPIAVFSPNARKTKTKSSWEGEHAGKWLYAASRAAYRSGDNALEENVRQVAGYLISTQEQNGYMGTNARGIRMTTDSTVNIKSWDVWIHTYLMAGLLEANKYFPDETFVRAAKKTGDLMIRTFMENNKSLAHNSYHHGMVGTGSLDAFVELYQTTNEQKYLDFALYCVRQMEYRKGLDIVSRSLKGYDLADIGNGKIYEMLRNYVGLAKLYKVTNNPDLLGACIHAWENITANHLTPTGGPWGGIEQHKECFNVGYMFSPYGLLETCSTMDWIRLNKELLGITGDARYAEELEKSAYNALLGAKFSDGYDWIYYSYTNGQRIKTGKWACCASSGTVALEEIPEAIGGMKNKGIAINIYTPSKIFLHHKKAGKTEIIQETGYPFDGNLKLSIKTEKETAFPLFLRIPSWADDPDISINGEPIASSTIKKGYLEINRPWKNQTLDIRFLMQPRSIVRANEYNHKGWYIDSTQYFTAFLKGPLVYAAEIKDTQTAPSGIVVKGNAPEKFIKLAKYNDIISKMILEIQGEEPIEMLPYYLVGDRKENIYKQTWFLIEKR